MRHFLSHRAWAFTVLLAVSFLIPPALRADPSTTTDGQSPPYIGVWKEIKYRPSGLNQYGAWLNRKVMWADISPNSFSPAAKTWAEIEMPFDAVWKTWMAEVPGRRAILLPAVFPTDGTSNLATAATGAYDAHFAALAKNLVDNNMANAIICMGPTNDWGSPIRIANKQDATNYVTFWRHIVPAMKSVPGADKLQFDWVAPGGKLGSSPQAAYPGNDWVDYIGFILSEGSGDRHIYPYPPFASESERIYHQKLAWDKVYYPVLQTWSTFAKAHGKPFSLPRWNLSADHTRSEGFDAQYFIHSVHDYIQNPANNVYFACYMEYYHYSWLSPTNGYTTNEPRAAAMYQKMFGLPATTQPAN